MDLNSLTSEIMQWAKDRDLHTAEPSKQMLKVVEELGELAEGMAKDDYNKQVDGLGDVYVTLVILSMQLGHNFQSCISVALNEIKDRKGKMVDGVFVKEEDL